MVRFTIFLAVGLTILLGSEAFFAPVQHDNLRIITPTTLDELKKALCNSYSGNTCADTTPTKIILNKVFDFTLSEGNQTETGCYHHDKPAKCLKIGQKKLALFGQCNGLKATEVTYSVAGRKALEVGSNKIIVGENGGGLKGKGLRIRNAVNVEVRNLSITDINPELVWGGDAMTIYNSKYVLIDGNYIKNIGRQMVVTSENNIITISNNVFDGNTPYGAVCDGRHYWLWLFLGENEKITLQNNVILNTSGRGPHLVASNNSKTLLHMIQNIFYNVKELIDISDTKSSILAEGNKYLNVFEVIHINKGNIYLPRTTAEVNSCKVAIGRECQSNTLVKPKRFKLKNSAQVLDDFKTYKDSLAKPTSMSSQITKWIQFPQEVQKYITGN